MKVNIENVTKLPLRIKARNKEEFNREHLLFTKLNRMIDSKYVITINYPDEMISGIEKPIKVDENEYQVKLLKTAAEYLYEGSYQGHCVGGYVTYSTHIVSVRLNKVWMTSEYDNKGINQQSRMKLNDDPTGEWIKVKEILNNRMKNLSYQDKLKEKKVEKVLIESLTTLQENVINSIQSEHEEFNNEYENIDANLILF